MSERIVKSNDDEAEQAADFLDGIVMEDAECEPTPRHLDTLYQQIYEVERTVSRHRFSNQEEAQEFGAQQSTIFNKALDEAGLLDEPVFFESADLIKPTFSIDYEAAEVTLGPPSPNTTEEGALLPTTYGLPEAGSGNLDYIGYVTMAEADGGDEMTWRVAFTYAIKGVPIETTWGTVIPRVQAPIGSSSIEYFADRHMRGAREALEVLLQHDSLEVAMLVNDLNVHLASPTEALIPPYVSEKVRAIHEHEGITQAYSDALLSLISMYIAPRGRQEFRATVSYEQDGRGGMKPVVVEGDVLAYEQRSEDILILPCYEQGTSERDAMSKEVYFVMNVGDVMHYVPFSAIMPGDADD